MASNIFYKKPTILNIKAAMKSTKASNVSQAVNPVGFKRATERSSLTSSVFSEVHRIHAVEPVT